MVLAILSYDSAPQNPSYSVDKCLRAIDRSEGGAFTPEAPPMQRVASKMALRQSLNYRGGAAAVYCLKFSHTGIAGGDQYQSTIDVLM
jgi:hypothetical protein